MKYKVLKRLFDPFLKRYVFPNETIDVPEKLYESYKPYITEKQKVEQPPIPDELPSMKFEEKPKRKAKK